MSPAKERYVHALIAGVKAKVLFMDSSKREKTMKVASCAAWCVGYDRFMDHAPKAQ